MGSAKGIMKRRSSSSASSSSSSSSSSLSSSQGASHSLALLLLLFLPPIVNTFLVTLPLHHHHHDHHHLLPSPRLARAASQPVSGTVADRAFGTCKERGTGNGVNVFYFDKFTEHRSKGYHPENYLRVAVAAQALKDLEGVYMKTDPEAWGVSIDEAVAAIGSVHDARYIADIKALSAKGGGFLDADTYTNYATYDVCVLATAAWLSAAKQTLLGTSETPEGTTDGSRRRPSFALTRPPGHHSIKDQAMGFCIFNFAVITAKYALEKLGCRKVAILDWDAHHGNGNEAFVEEDSRICYASLHQQDAYPLTGRKSDDRGPHGNILDLAIPAYTDIRTYDALIEGKVLPFLAAFEPDLVIVSAGYDCLADDPLAQLALGPQDFTILSTRLKDTFGDDKLIFGLEGGYDPERVAEAIVATLSPFFPSTTVQ